MCWGASQFAGRHTRKFPLKSQYLWLGWLCCPGSGVHWPLRSDLVNHFGFQLLLLLWWLCGEHIWEHICAATRCIILVACCFCCGDCAENRDTCAEEKAHIGNGMWDQSLFPSEKLNIIFVSFAPQTFSVANLRQIWCLCPKCKSYILCFVIQPTCKEKCKLTICESLNPVLSHVCFSLGSILTWLQKNSSWIKYWWT